jgi:PAS domain S-box-containing protein
VRLDPHVVDIAAEPDPSRRIERLLEAARSLLRADDVSLTLGESADVSDAATRSGAQISAPLQGAEGVVGVLWARTLRPDGFTSDDEQALAAFGTLVAGALREQALAAQVQRADQTSEQRLRDFAEASSDWFWEQDEQLRFTWISPSVTTTLGLDPRQMYRKTARETQPLGVDEAAWLGHEEVLRARQPFRDFRFSRIYGDGQLRTVSVSGRPIFDETGAFRGYRGVGANVTPQIEAEARALQAYRSLVDAIESLHDGLLLYDADDRLIVANRRVAELAPPLAGVIKPGVRFEEVVRAAAARGYYRGVGETEEDIVATRLGSEPRHDTPPEMHFDDQHIVLIKQSRTRDGGRLILLEDVTELRRAMAALEVSEQTYRMMVDGVDDIIYRTDEDGRFTYVNRRVSEILGWTAEQLVGTHYLDLIHAEYRSSAARFYVRQFARRVPTTYYEFPAIAKGGSEVWVGQQVRLLEEGGKIVGALAVARDITARKRAEQQEHEQLEARVTRARTLNRLAQVISSSLDLETVLSEIARAANALLDAPVVRFWMVDEEAQTTWLAAEASDDPELAYGSGRLALSDLSGILGWVIRERQAVRIPVASADARVRDAAWWQAHGLTSFLGQPVMLDGRLLAVLNLWGREPFAFDADEGTLLESFVSQAALSIRNAQLYRDTDQQRQRLQSLVEVSQRLSRGLNLAEVLDAITEAAASIFEGEAGLRLMVGNELVRASVSRGARHRPSMARVTTEGGLIGEVLRTGRPLSTPDVAGDDRIPGTFREILQHDRMTALLVAPIRTEDRVIGTIHIYRERGHEWRDDALNLAASLADQAAAAIENATRYAGLQDSLERARIPARVNQLLSAALDLDVLLREIATAAVKVSGAVVASLWLADEPARTLRLAVFSDEAIGEDQAFRHAAYGEGAAGWVAEHRETLHVDDIFADGRTAGVEWWRRYGLKSSYTTPVIDGDTLVAVLSINGREPIQIGDDTRELVNGLVAQTTAALRNAALYREVTAANRRLEQEVRRNELLLNSVADGVFGLDADCHITFLNPAALRLLGYPAAELLGHDTHAQLHRCGQGEHGEALPDEPLCAIREAVRLGRPFRSSAESLWRRDGISVPVELVLTPLQEDGMELGAVVTFRDITREKEAERQRRALAQNEKLRALGQLAGGVAHDLNQSLGLVVGHSELALDSVAQVPDLPPDLRESLETIMQGALDGAQTVRRLQTFVRGQPEGDAERISLGSLVTDVVRLTAPRWRDAAQAAGAPVSVSVNVELAGDDEILGWSPSLREALTNLVFNALDAMPRGGDLQLVVRTVSAMVAVEVIDTGSGMPPEVAARIFEPFFTTKGERGTGLGLAMVYGIVERHNGRIEVDSAPGRGTTIRLLLPRAARAAQTGVVDERAPEGQARDILVVDDEEALRRMLTRMLTQDGHQVVAVPTADDALARLAERRFDLVLSDHGLGLGMNGLELATAVRDRWPGTRFILVTGWGGSMDPAEVAPLGVEAVISKPYRAPELRRWINARP